MISTSTAFRANELLQTSLAETFEQTHVKIALGIVRDLGEPREMNPGNVPFLEFNALQNARREGYFLALSNLTALAVKPPKPTKRELMPPLVDEDSYEPERNAEQQRA
jgi:hypothetical protein